MKKKSLKKRKEDIKFTIFAILFFLFYLAIMFILLTKLE